MVSFPAYAAENMGTYIGECVLDKSVGKRFIPVELWLGVPWDGNEEIRLPTVDKTHQRSSFSDYDNKRNHYKSEAHKGPMEWDHPGTGKKIFIYERVNDRSIQLWAIRKDQQAMGRVFSPSQNRGSLGGEAKFPLGWWTQDEVREFTRTSYVGEKKWRSVNKIRIDKLSCEYNGIKNSLEFSILFAGSRGPNVSHTYIHAPGHGLVHVITRFEVQIPNSVSNKDRAVAYFNRKSGTGKIIPKQDIASFAGSIDLQIVAKCQRTMKIRLKGKIGNGKLLISINNFDDHDIKIGGDGTFEANIGKTKSGKAERVLKGRATESEIDIGLYFVKPGTPSTDNVFCFGRNKGSLS